MTLGFVISLLLHGNVLLSPKAEGNVLELTIYAATIKPLVGGGRLQGPKVSDIGTHLDVIEVLLVDNRRNTDSSAIPCHMELGMILVDVLCQLVDSTRVGIATHKGDASDVCAVLRHEIINGICRQGHTHVLPEIMAVAARAVTRAIRDINCQCHFVGYLLKNNSSINVFQHGLSLRMCIETTCSLFLTGL